jgi:hypothetical protein
LLRSLANCIRHFGSLAEPEAYVSPTIAGYDKGAEAETTTTLNYLSNTVDENRLVRQLTAVVCGNPALIERILKSHTSPN